MKKLLALLMLVLPVVGMESSLLFSEIKRTARPQGVIHKKLLEDNLCSGFSFFDKNKNFTKVFTDVNSSFFQNKISRKFFFIVESTDKSAINAKMFGPSCLDMFLRKEILCCRNETKKVILNEVQTRLKNTKSQKEYSSFVNSIAIYNNTNEYIFYLLTDNNQLGNFTLGM